MDDCPAGGWADFHGATADLEEAKAVAAELAGENDWVEVVDLETLSEVDIFTLPPEPPEPAK